MPYTPLDPGAFADSMIKDGAINGGLYYMFKFPNGFGAGVVKHYFSYGHEDDLFELAVFKYKDGKSELTYETPITDDVIGHLDNADVLELLTRIQQLPTKTAPHASTDQSNA